MQGKDAAIALGAAIVLAWARAAAAQATQQLNTAPGVPLPLVVESGTHPDCTVGAPPEMKVLIAPAHGELTLREGQLRRRGSACPASPGYVVVYVPDEDFNGADMVTIQVSEAGQGPTTMAFDILIRGKITPPAGGV